MATVIHASSSVFKQVTGWTDGPKKPTVSTSNTTVAAAQAILSAASTAISSLAPGESINIVVTATDEGGS